MADPTTNEPLSHTNDLTLETGDPAVAPAESSHTDPLTGEPGAHPAAVGVGAFGAGAAGAAIGALAGPIGAVIGAAIGAIAGGLAGHEVAVSNDETTETSTADLNAEDNGSVTDVEGRPSSVAGTPVPVGGTPMILPGYDVGLPLAVPPAVPVDDGSDTVTDVSFSPAAAAARGAGEYREFAAGNALSTPVAGSEPSSPAVGSSSTGGSASVSATDRSALANDFGSAAVSEPAGADLFGKPDGPGFTVGADPTETVRTAAYYRYLDRLEAGRNGDELGDWLDAEREVTRF